MKKTIIILLSVLSVISVFGQDFANVEITSEQVRDNIHVLFGRGGNIGVLAGEDGFVLVDDQFAPLSYKIRTALSRIGPGEVTFTINTHYHYDHADGNKAFGPAGAWIVAHENTRKRLMQENRLGADSENLHIQEKYPDDALPKLTFENAMNLHLNGQTVHIFHLENAHTDTDAIIYFQEANVMHTGDVFVRYGIPFIDDRNGGSVKGMIAANSKLIELCDDETIIIPGHGQPAKKQDVIDFRDMLQDIWDQVAAAVKAGKSVEEILENDPSKKYGEGNLGAYVVKTIFKELK